MTNPDRVPPSLAELKETFERYFFGPFDDDQVSKLRATIAEQMADTPVYGGLVSSFHPGNGGIGYGLAWREEFAYKSTYPTALEMSIWIAWSSGLKPRNYCPAAFVGEWEQTQPVVEGERPRWSFHADGGFSTSESRFSPSDAWCVHRHGPTGPVADVLWFQEAGRVARSLFIDAMTDSTLTGKAMGAYTVEYRLQRVEPGSR